MSQFQNWEICSPKKEKKDEREEGRKGGMRKEGRKRGWREEGRKG